MSVRVWICFEALETVEVRVMVLSGIFFSQGFRRG